METTTPKTKITNMAHYDMIKRVGTELKVLRTRAGLTIENIVELSQGELNKNTVCAMENARYNPSIRHVEAYANALGYQITFEKRPENQTPSNPLP